MKAYQNCVADATGEILNISGSGWLNLLELSSDSNNSLFSTTVTIDGVASILTIPTQNIIAGLQHSNNSVNGASLYSLFMPFRIRFKESLVINITTGTATRGAVVDYTLD